MAGAGVGGVPQRGGGQPPGVRGEPVRARAPRYPADEVFPAAPPGGGGAAVFDPAGVALQGLRPANPGQAGGGRDDPVGWAVAQPRPAGRMPSQLRPPALAGQASEVGGRCQQRGITAVPAQATAEESSPPLRSVLIS